MSRDSLTTAAWEFTAKVFDTGMQVERELSRNMMREHCTVDMHRPFWRAGCPTGEMQEGPILGVGRLNCKIVARLSKERAQIQGACYLSRLSVVADEQNML